MIIYNKSRPKQSSSSSTDIEEEQSRHLIRKKVPSGKNYSDSIKTKMESFNNKCGRVISSEKDKQMLYNTPASPEGSPNFSNERDETNNAIRESDNTPGHCSEIN